MSPFPRTRFAPSPSGELHLGHAYSAWCAWEVAQRQPTQFLLRLEDLDHTRCRPEFAQSLMADLHWLGLNWPTPVLHQQQRQPAYQDALDILHHQGLLYPCFCTRREIQSQLQDITRAPHHGTWPLYPGTCRTLTTAQIAQKRTHTEPAWRLHLPHALQLAPPLSLTEHWAPTAPAPLPVDHSDPVLARRDIGTSYHLAVVVDDAFQDITAVVRGLDLYSFTPLHLLLQKLLKLPTPSYYHHPLVTDDQGRRLAKRDRDLSLHQWRHAHPDPQALFAHLPPVPISQPRSFSLPIHVR